MGQESEALVPAHALSIERELILPAPVLGDGARDGVVKASVQRAEIIRADRRAQFYRQLGDRLTHVAVLMHDLRDGESLKPQGLSVLDRASSNSGVRFQPVAQRVHQLVQEQGHPVIDLGVNGR